MAGGETSRPARANVVRVDALYVLDSVARQALPAVDESSSESLHVEVLAESLWLRPDGSFIARTTFRETKDGHAPSVSSIPDSGGYGFESAGPRLGDGIRSGSEIPPGHVILRGPRDFVSWLWVRNGGLLLEGPGLPRPPGGTAALRSFIYRRVPRRSD